MAFGHDGGQGIIHGDAVGVRAARGRLCGSATRKEGHEREEEK